MVTLNVWGQATQGGRTRQTFAETWGGGWAAAFLGHPPEVRDYGLLESAIARTQATVFGEDAYPDMHGKAAALLSSLVKNHALVDGNKRLGLVSVPLLYAMIDYAFEATDDEKFELVMSVAEGRPTDIEDIARTLEQFASSLD